jgi:glycosyltransferase involved in cell wall biosynthesis
MIDVLLVSPRLPPADNRYSGDNAYTDTLLQFPPPGVRYHHYEDLMATGQVRKIKWLYRIGPRLVRWGILPPDLWAEYLISDFVPDILHIYGFSAVVRFPKNSGPVPVVLGAGTGSYSDLRYYLGWSEHHVRRARWRKRQYLRIIDAHDSSQRPEKAARVLVWSEFSKRMHLEEGHVCPDQIEVLYPGLRWRGETKLKHHDADDVTFLFVGRDFERKNGLLVLEAFRRVRARYPNMRLILVSRPADRGQIVEPGVTHYLFLPRQELLERIYPQADVLILPSKAEGFGLVLLEAMSFGMPVIGVNGWAMPEIIRHDVNGWLIEQDSVDELARLMDRCAASPELLAAMSKECQEHFMNRFSIERHNQSLRETYDRVILGQSS